MIRADWSQYRGPNHNGISSERILKTWPSSGPRLIWRKSLPDGFGSFTISQDRAFTAVKRRIDGKGMEVFLALNSNTGEEIWSITVGPAARDGISGEGDGPRSTPVVDGEYVYLLSAYMKLLCLNKGDGSVVWQRDFIQEFGGKGPDFEAAASPLVVGDLVLLNGPTGGSGEKLMGINKFNGNTIWTGPSAKVTHSTPSYLNLFDTPQVLFYTVGGVISVTPETGKELWRYPFSVTVSTSMSPVVGDNIVYHSAAYAVGARAARLTKSGTSFQISEIWRKKNELITFWSTPIYYNGHLFGLYGQDYGASAPLKCVELATGTEKWSQPGFGAGQVLLVDKTILMLTADGKLVLVEPNLSGYKELARFKALSGLCWNAPAIHNGRLYARSNKEGVCLDLTPPPLPRLAIRNPSLESGSGYRFYLTCSDGSIMDTERMQRLEIIEAASLSKSLHEWTSVTNCVFSTDSSVFIPAAESSAQRFFMVIEK